MEKKKLKKLKINKMDGFSIISEQEQMKMKGGYSQAEADAMMDNGTWTGGYVDGLGYVAQDVVVYGLDLQKWAGFFYDTAGYDQGSYESDYERWERILEQNRSTGGYDPGPIREWLIRNFLW